MIISIVIAILMLVVAFVGSFFMAYCCWGTDHPELVALFAFIAVWALAMLTFFVSLIYQLWPLREGLL